MTNSNELLERALRELETVTQKKFFQVEIVLDELFCGNNAEARKYCHKLNLKNLTEKLSKKFVNYNITSRIKRKNLRGLIMFENAPCNPICSLVWELTLQEK